MGFGAVQALLIIGAISTSSAQYFGKELGPLSQLEHGVRGSVYAVDSRTLYLKDFYYDGEGPAAYFYVGASKTPHAAGAVRLRDERGGTGPLRKYRGESVALSLPDGKTLKDFRWFAVWCDEYSVNFGDVSIPRDSTFPRPARLAALHGAHSVNSDPIVVVDAQTLLVPNFSYDGEAPDAKFWVGRGEKPSPQGIKIPDENGKEAPLRRYDKKTIVLTLPGELTVFDIGYFAVWCEAFTVNFGHVVLPAAQLQNVPPSLKMLGVSPQSKLNCEVLYDELAFEVRWAVAGDSIVLQLVAKLEDNDYMSFGISGDAQHSQMVGGDVAVAWVDKETLKGYVFDYFLDAKSQCAGVRGSCPDEALGDKTNSVRLLNAALVNGYSIVTYQRSLKAADGLDKAIFTNVSQPVIWALGPLNSKNEVSYHHHFTKGDRIIDFGRAPLWNCPMPEGEEDHKPAVSDHASHVEVSRPVPRPSQDQYSNHQINPKPVPEPKPVAKVVPWEIPAIQCYEPPDGVFYAQLGPTGGKHGYPAITGHVGWGISWYINGLLIPVINVVRGKKYTFVTEGGTNPEIPAKYHPFYITNDPIGGFYHKTQAEKQGVEIYAGVRKARNGELIPTGVGRLCNWTPDKDGPEADEYPSFGAYQRSLTLVCEQGDPGVITWIPDKNTPDTVYYQCFTHRHLGWKINVLDSCDEQAEAEESRVIQFAQPADLAQEESIQVESRINSNSNYLDQHKKVEKIINTNKSNYNNFSSNKAVKHGEAKDHIQPFSNAQEYELLVSKGQIKDVIEAVESLESQMQEEARRNHTHLSQYQVHENNHEHSIPEQPIHENQEYVIDHAHIPGNHFLPPGQKPHTLQSVLRTSGQRPAGHMRPPHRRPAPPEIKVRRPNPPAAFHEGYSNVRNNFFTPHAPIQNYMHPQKKIPPQKYHNMRVPPPGHHMMHNKPSMHAKPPPQYHHSGPLTYKVPPKPMNNPSSGMNLSPLKMNNGLITYNQDVNQENPNVIANQVVKSQILLPGAIERPDDVEAQQSVPIPAQNFIHRPDQIILGKPIENPVPLDQQMIPDKLYDIMTAPITPPVRPKHQKTTPIPENHEVIRGPSSNEEHQDVYSSDFLGQQVESSSFSPAVNTGFKPDTVVIESGFKPIIREPLMDRTDEYRIADEKFTDQRQQDEKFTQKIANPNRRIDSGVEDYFETTPQHLSSPTLNSSSSKITETFEPIFVPSPEDHTLNKELNTDSTKVSVKESMSNKDSIKETTKEVFPSNHATEERPHPVYIPSTQTKPKTSTLFDDKKEITEMSSDMVMASDRISTQYLPPDTPKDKTQKPSTADATYTTYDGKTISAATLTSVSDNVNYDEEFLSWKLPANSERLINSPQLGPFMGEIPPSSDVFFEEKSKNKREDAQTDIKIDSSLESTAEHKVTKREDEPKIYPRFDFGKDEETYENTDTEEENDEFKLRRKREIQTTQYEENVASTTTSTQHSFTNGHMHHTEYQHTSRSSAYTSNLYFVLLVLGTRYI